MAEPDLATQAETTVIELLTAAGLVKTSTTDTRELPLVVATLLPSKPQRAWAVSCYQTSHDTNPNPLETWADVQIRVREPTLDATKKARAAIDQALNLSHHHARLLIHRSRRLSWGYLGRDAANLHELTANYRITTS